ARDFSLPGAESQKAFDLLHDRFPQVSGDTAQLVFRDAAGVTDAQVRARTESLFTRLQSVPHVVSISSPYSPTGAGHVSPDGTTAFADVQFDVRASNVPKPVVDRILRLGRQADGSGLQIEFGGQVIEQAEFQPPGQSTGA